MKITVITVLRAALAIRKIDFRAAYIVLKKKLSHGSLCL